MCAICNVLSIAASFLQQHKVPLKYTGFWKSDVGMLEVSNLKSTLVCANVAGGMSWRPEISMYMYAHIIIMYTVSVSM